MGWRRWLAVCQFEGGVCVRVMGVGGWMDGWEKGYFSVEQARIFVCARACVCLSATSEQPQRGFDVEYSIMIIIGALSIKVDDGRGGESRYSV